MGTVWLASYPKSGNTWVRFLLANYFLGDVRSSRDVSRAIPDLHVKGQFPPATPWLTPTKGHLLAKTHLAFTPAHPAVEQTAGLIYIIRHPKDVLLSSLNHRRLEGEEPVKALGPFSDEEYVRIFIQGAGDPIWREMGYGSWTTHAESWLTEKRFPHLCLRYEELRTDPAAHLRAALGFLGEPVDDVRLAQAVKRSSFEQLRALEIREKHEGASHGVFAGDRSSMKKGIFFMNKGRTGQNLAAIGPGLDEAFDRRFGAAIAQYCLGGTAGN